MQNTEVKASELERFSIEIYDPLGEFLKGKKEEFRFALSLLDVARFSGHCCVAVTGAFFVAKSAIEELFPDGICIRGDLEIDIPEKTVPGATGPVANVFSFITGSWGDSGFQGLNGNFRRQGLLRMKSDKVANDSFLFTRLSTGKSVTCRFHPEKIIADINPESDFPTQLRAKVTAILANPNELVTIEKVLK